MLMWSESVVWRMYIVVEGLYMGVVVGWSQAVLVVAIVVVFLVVVVAGYAV